MGEKYTADEWYMIATVFIMAKFQDKVKQIVRTIAKDDSTENIHKLYVKLSWIGDQDGKDKAETEPVSRFDLMDIGDENLPTDTGDTKP
jgi:hypothetical protein